MGDCNKNKCKPACNPCTTQPKIYYCGQPVECLNIKRGDKLDNIIKTVGDKVCQLQTYTDLMTYVNVIDATEEQCEYGGYVIQVLGTVNDEVVSEHIICNESVLEFYLNDTFLSVPEAVNFESGYGVNVSGVDEGSGYTTYTFDLADVVYEDITWQEGMDLISSNDVKIGVHYRVTDRGWYIKGTLTNKFSTDGYIMVQCPKQTYYIPSGIIKGMFNPFNGVYSTGDLVVYGGRVWQNSAGVNGSSIDTFKLDNTIWDEQVAATFYDDVLLKMHYDYEGDWVFRFEDLKNNIINVPKNIYGSSPSPTNFWADWLMPGAFNNNNCQPILNNLPSSGYLMLVTSNIGHFDIIGNKASSMSFNRCTITIKGNNSANISFNVSTSFVGNTCPIIMFNTGNGEAGLAIVSNNTSNVISSNIIQSTIADNTIAVLTNNIVNGDVLRNSFQNFSGNTIMNVISDNISDEEKLPSFNNNLVYGDIKTNTLHSSYSYNKNVATIENNTSFTSLNSNLNSSVTGNTTLNILNSTLIGVCTGNTEYEVTKSIIKGDSQSNTDTTINGSEVIDVTTNNDVEVINTKCAWIRGNTSSYFSTNFVDFEIGNNENVTALNNYCISLLENKNVEEMRYNNTRGSIAYNEDFDKIIWNSCGRGIDKNKATGYTGCEITYNTNAGLISRNIFQNNSVTINNNNNNGNIGNELSDTNRATSVSGTVVDI